MKQYENLIVDLICDGVGKETEELLEEYRKRGFIELPKLDYVQIIVKLEAILDITTGWLNHEDLKIDLEKLSNHIEKIISHTYSVLN